MEERERGTVTSLASLISVEEAQKAAKRVEDSIAEHQKELDHLHHFISDNTNLINLVQKLPDELSHDIMARYYVERTSKQTAEILQRRGKVLDSQVDALKAMMLDLKAEASFFGSTAAEAAEGVVEIREDYIEEHPTGRVSDKADLAKPDTLGSSEAANAEVAAEDEEYAQIMSRFDELEKEELEAECVNDVDEDEDSNTDFGCSINQHSFEQNLKISEEHQHRNSLKQSNSRNFPSITEEPLYEEHSGQNPADQSTFQDLKVQHLPKDEYLPRESLARMDKSNPTEKPLLSLEKEKTQVMSTTKSEIYDDKAAEHNSKIGFDSSKAFTGSVIEHSLGIHAKPVGETTAPSQSTRANPSKPVSRFKMQKGGR
ncbi:hypothetical protein BVC80_7835g1 [Macleaya cordata]|uniref:Prefoldin n=1 Tax=Macleaya cordata TaxID=56857 RepID=A0A200Q890_MACCD|nr:hypothetical protein BVC80_7835g1 [Macleaya cordata]